MRMRMQGKTAAMIGIACMCFAANTMNAKVIAAETQDGKRSHQGVVSNKKLVLLEGTVDVTALKAIVTAPAPAKLEQQAARELSNYLKKMYGVSLPVKAEENITAEMTGVFFVGKTAALKAGAVSEEELRKVEWDGYVIKASPKFGSIVIAGPRGLATLFGVTGFLEHLGCRFYGPVETVPAPAEKTIQAFTLSDRPAFEFRRISSRDWKLKGSTALDVGVWGKVPDYEKWGWTKGNKDWVARAQEHTAGVLLAPQIYYDAHPEYYAMLSNGERMSKKALLTRNNFRVALCLSNPEMIRVSAENLLKWIENEPEKRFFTCTYGDTNTHCQCPECKKLDAVPGQYMDRMLHWVNAVARIVHEKYPDKVLITYSYLNTQKIPRRLKPESNVIVLYTPWWGLSTNCRKHPYSICWKSIRGALEMEDWLKCAPGNLGVYDYSIGSHPQLHSYEYKIRFWAKRGYRGFWECGNPTGFRDLENFIKAKLLWDPSLDPATLEDEFCKAYYGPAGKHVAALIRTFYNEKVDNGTHKNRGDPEYPAKMLACFEGIAKAAPGTPFEKRATADVNTFMKQVHGYGLAERKKRLAACAADGSWGKGGLLPEIEPKEGYQGYTKDKLWLSKPKIARKGAKDDAELTPLTAICAQGPANMESAKKLQTLIQTIYGIELPIEDRAVDKDTKGVIVVGKKAALASCLITEADFQAAGPDGAVVRGTGGRIALATTKEENTSLSFDLFVYIMKMRHGGLKALEGQLPKAKAPIIREFTLIDWPPFGPNGDDSKYPGTRH